MGFLDRLENGLWRKIQKDGPPKTENPLRFGVLGVGEIVIEALINPARLHPEVVVEAVASADQKKAEAFAKEHGIPKIFDCYLDLINDPSIDAVYIPLPNNIRFEWTSKALSAGKHVLVEKPPASNSTEAGLLFQSPLLQGPSAPVLLAGFHYRFQPCYIAFLALLDRSNIAHAKVNLTVWQNVIFKKDTRFVYDLAGGALLDMPYALVLLRDIFDDEPVECTRCKVDKMASLLDALSERNYDTAWRFPNGGVGEAKADLVGSTGVALRVAFMKQSEWLGEAPNDSESSRTSLAVAEVTHRPVVVPDPRLPEGQEKVLTRIVKLDGNVWGCLSHRIEVVDKYVVRNMANGQILKKWTDKETKTAYTLQEAGIDLVSSSDWTSYKYQLDQFVNQVRQRQGTGVWISHQDSMRHVRMTDMAYHRAELPVRPTSSFRLHGQ